MTATLCCAGVMQSGHGHMVVPQGHASQLYTLAIIFRGGGSYLSLGGQTTSAINIYYIIHMPSYT